MEIWAWIPARGGSQGIPRKNIRLLDDIPLIVHSIRYAKQFPFITRVLLTTDDEEIAKIGVEAGAELATDALRPSYLAGHYTRDIEVLEYLIDWYEKNEGILPVWWVQLRPTYPLRSLRVMNDIYGRYMKENTVAVRTIVKSAHTPLKMYYKEGGELIPLFEKWGNIIEPNEAPRQLLSQCYWHNGCIDVIRTDIVKQYHTCCPPGIIGYEMEENETNDIDTIDDFTKVSEVIQFEKFLK